MSGSLTLGLAVGAVVAAAMSAVRRGTESHVRRRLIGTDLFGPELSGQRSSSGRKADAATENGTTRRPGARLSRWWLSRREGREGYNTSLISALDTAVATLAAGGSLVRAIEDAAGLTSPAGRDLVAVARRSARGVPLHDALDRWGRESGEPGARLTADALNLSGVTGGSHRKALERVAATLRERQALAREVAALAAQTRASAVLLVATPIGFATIMALVDRRTATFLLTTWGGWMCVLGGLGLNATGAAWMRLLLRRAT